MTGLQMVMTMALVTVSEQSLVRLVVDLDDSRALQSVQVY